ncbi:nitronate monooxygenase [Malassezia psittaci]|uniref:Nitronate monooxygenase n=1 Tax=Malassezia psittaci TaxID=1821823 RepID=A0AAF0JF58_9BASI|nr:nitronate monooxygenase [Malassezia psittaci]
MANAAGGQLAGMVSHAGGLGFIGAGYYDRAKLQSEIQLARSILHTRTDILPIGIGFLAWRLDKIDQAHAEALVQTALDAKPSAVWFSYGPEKTIEKWCKYAKQASDPPSVFVTASTIHAVHEAWQSPFVDAIVLQGLEAGGHGLGSGCCRDELVSEAIHALQASSSSTPKKLLSAGGIADGRQIAAQLALGMDAVVLGTRFLLTPEALYTDAQKQLLLKSNSSDTVRSVAFDEARNTMDWPQGIDGRGLRNATVDDFNAASAQGHEHNSLSRPLPGYEQRQERYREAQASGDTTRIITWAGTGVGFMHDIVPASDLVHRLAVETRDSLQQAALRLGNTSS